MAEPNSWEDLLRKMLPEGAPLPDEDQLDYSISFDYVGPSPFFNAPTNPMIPKTRFTAFPKQPPSLTPKNPPWPKSRSSSDTTNSDNKRLSASSIASDDATDHKGEDDGVDALDDATDHNCKPGDYEGESEMKLGGACASSSGNKGRKCIRCGKGVIGLFRGTEGCIVCGAEYCRKCVLKAMGSMPEGRKCVGCIGNPIDEANRGKLGKASRFMERLCIRLEVRKIMQVERECKANQIRPQQITVNGRELREDELDELLGCRVPPKGLKPGRYWYDKDSGLWGKVNIMFL